MPNDPPRIAREKQTIRAMVGIYCRGHHGTAGELCPECEEFLSYALGRLDHCPFGTIKPTCAKCRVHCYKPAMRAKVKQIMAYAGPRMMLRRPLLALRHWLDARGDAPELPGR